MMVVVVLRCPHRLLALQVGFEGGLGQQGHTSYPWGLRPLLTLTQNETDADDLYRESARCCRR